MNKIEKILQNNIQNNKWYLSDLLKKDIINAIKEFGELSFEAARKGKYADKHAMYGDNCYYNIYNTFEEFLKEVEDE